MARILGNYGIARESAYFKVENEADVSKRKQKLVDEGKLNPMSLPSTSQPETPNAPLSIDVDASILQQQTRLDDPHLLQWKDYKKRVKAEPPPLSPEQYRRSKLASYSFNNHHGNVVPKLSLRPRATDMTMPATVPHHPQPRMSHHALEAANRGYNAAVRSYAYGTALCFAGLALAAGWASQKSALNSKEAIAEIMQPVADRIKNEWSMPVKQWFQGFAIYIDMSKDPNSTSDSSSSSNNKNGGGEDGHIIKRMRERFNPKYGGKSPFGGL
jgi:hypothetical protein